MWLAVLIFALCLKEQFHRHLGSHRACFKSRAGCQVCQTWSHTLLLQPALLGQQCPENWTRTQPLAKWNGQKAQDRPVWSRVLVSSLFLAYLWSHFATLRFLSFEGSLHVWVCICEYTRTHFSKCLTLYFLQCFYIHHPLSYLGEVK